MFLESSSLASIINFLKTFKEDKITMMSETVELLGKGLYANIPDTLTLKAFPTVTELDYVGSEDFERTMLENIFPQCIEEKINFHNLLEIDFQWICRCLRFLNYGPYFTVNGLICNNCGPIRVECQVDLRAVECKGLPANFIHNDIVIKKGDLIDYNKDIHLHLLTIQEALDLRKDKLFTRPDGQINVELARICYSISKIDGVEDLSPVVAKVEVEKNMTPADYKVLKATVADLTDYGLRGGGYCQCPRCHSNNAAFVALADDRFFRPTVGDLRKGRDDRSLRGIKKPTTDSPETV